MSYYISEESEGLRLCSTETYIVDGSFFHATPEEAIKRWQRISRENMNGWLNCIANNIKMCKQADELLEKEQHKQQAAEQLAINPAINWSGAALRMLRHYCSQCAFIREGITQIMEAINRARQLLA